MSYPSVFGVNPSSTDPNHIRIVLLTLYQTVNPDTATPEYATAYTKALVDVANLLSINLANITLPNDVPQQKPEWIICPNCRYNHGRFDSADQININCDCGCKISFVIPIRVEGYETPDP